MSQKYLIVIAGPTAIGKTELSIRLARYFNTVVLSADSRQIYKELNIGVAKPTEAQLREVKHYFISHISIQDDYSAYEYQKEVHHLLPQLFQNHDIVIMTGGTGFYINAVLNGLNEIPKISSHTKTLLQDLYQKKGIQYLQDELFKRDPLYYQKVDIQNPIRLLRALEVIYETGQPFSYFLNDKLIKKPDYFTSINIFLNTNRYHLYDKINQRVYEMIENGLYNEVKNLYTYRYLKPLNTVGYKEWWPFIEGRINMRSVIYQIQKNTHQYAKRQITWFKHQWQAREIKIDLHHTEQSFNLILSHIQNFLS